MPMNPDHFSEEIQNASRFLKEGKIILYPTDTIWGLGCSIDFEEAVDKIFELKGRPRKKSMILLVNSLEMLKKYTIRIHPRIFTLLSYHNRPLTVIYPRTQNLSKSLLAEDGSIAIRVCKDPFCSMLIESLQCPIVSTSANISDEPAPVVFNDISAQIISSVDYVVKHRQNESEPSQPSTIISYDDEGEITVIRA